jgi:hypothetical protein
MGDRKYYGALVDQQWHPDYVYFPYADLKEIIKGVNCPKCEKQWLGHHFNGARWCADCGHSFYGKQFCCIEVAQRHASRPVFSTQWDEPSRLTLEADREQILRDTSRPVFSTQWDEVNNAI